MKDCKRCGFPEAPSGFLYCPKCQKLVLAELDEAGYLTRTAWSRHRSADQREDVRETKYGKDR